MAHGDNRGLKLPPKVAPTQVVVVPVAMHKDGVKEKAEELFNEINEEYRAEIDLREQFTPGYKFNDWEMRGVPIRIEIGPKDIENGVCVLVRRDTAEKIIVKLEDINKEINDVLKSIQENLYNECKKRMESKTTVAYTLDEFVKQINEDQGFIKTMWCGNVECENKIKELTAAKSRCMPFKQEKISDNCVCCGKKANKMVIWGRQY